MKKHTILNQRLEKSAELLSNPCLHISEIAYEVEFNDPKYFSRCFRQKFGCSPKEYRIMNLETEKLNIFRKSFIHQIDEVIVENLDNLNFTLEVFAQMVCMSKQNLYMKMKQYTGMSPIRYIRNKKISHARNLLKGNQQVQEVMAQVGFFDDKYFIKCFRQETGITPFKYQKMANLNIA